MSFVAKGFTMKNFLRIFLNSVSMKLSPFETFYVYGNSTVYSVQFAHSAAVKYDLCRALHCYVFLSSDSLNVPPM